MSEDKIAKAQKEAEKMRKAKRTKYAQLTAAGIPAEIARKAIDWGPDRIKKELGVELPAE